MTDEAQTTFFLRAQSKLLESSLNEISDQTRRQRKAITRCLSQAFVDLVNRLNVPLILEIGAHDGRFSTEMKKSRPESRVVAFEAHPLVYARYAPAMEQAGVEYLKLRVADREGEVILRAPKKAGRESRGMGSLLRLIKATEWSEHPVSAVTLDGFLGDATSLPNAMWIDVEGALASIFAGAEHTLPHCQAVYREVEAKARWEGQMIDLDVVSHLARYGLRPFLRDIQRRRQYNLIFVR